MDPSWVCYRWVMMGTPTTSRFNCQRNLFNILLDCDSKDVRRLVLQKKAGGTHEQSRTITKSSGRSSPKDGILLQWSYRLKQHRPKQMKRNKRKTNCQIQSVPPQIFSKEAWSKRWSCSSKGICHVFLFYVFSLGNHGTRYN